MASTIQPLSSALALTTTLTAATNTSIVEGFDYHTLDFAWTPGTTSNVLTIAIDHRVNANTDGPWTQDMKWVEAPAGTLTRTLLQLQHTATGTTEVAFYYSFELHAGEVRIRVSESEAGGVTKGTISSFLTSSSS